MRKWYLYRLCKWFVDRIELQEAVRVDAEQKIIKKEAAEYMEEYLKEHPEVVETMYMNPIAAPIPLYKAQPPKYCWEAMKRGEIRFDESRNEDRS